MDGFIKTTIDTKLNRQIRVVIKTAKLRHEKFFFQNLKPSHVLNTVPMVQLCSHLNSEDRLPHDLIYKNIKSTNKYITNHTLNNYTAKRRRKRVGAPNEGRVAAIGHGRHAHGRRGRRKQQGRTHTRRRTTKSSKKQTRNTN